jgi:Ca2+-transporting ATPase
VVLGTCISLAVVLLIPFAQRLFHFAPLHAKDAILSLGAGLVCVLWFELLKLRKCSKQEARQPYGMQEPRS